METYTKDPVQLEVEELAANLIPGTNEWNCYRDLLAIVWRADKTKRADRVRFIWQGLVEMREVLVNQRMSTRSLTARIAMCEQILIAIDLFTEEESR
jgi:hypothetical protein